MKKLLESSWFDDDLIFNVRPIGEYKHHIYSRSGTYHIKNFEFVDNKLILPIHISYYDKKYCDEIFKLEVKSIDKLQKILENFKINYENIDNSFIGGIGIFVFQYADICHLDDATLYYKPDDEDDEDDTLIQILELFPIISCY
ncbi:MAG: hypothetical protein ACRC4T_25670 [Cetobacterium sp.]